MTEYSQPLVGVDLEDDYWSQAVGASGNGILEDWGNPYAITVNTNDTVTIKVSSVGGDARAVVAGFAHRMDANQVLSVPAVSTTTTYWIGLLYDPASTTIPVMLKVLTGATLTLAAGQQFLPIHQIVRTSGQALLSATLLQMRPRIAPTITAPQAAGLLATSPRSFLYGTTVYCVDTARTYRALGTASTPSWAPVKDAIVAEDGTPLAGKSVMPSMYARVQPVQTIPNNAATYLKISGSLYNGITADKVGAGTTFTVPVSGWYTISCSVTHQTQSTENTRWMYIYSSSTLLAQQFLNSPIDGSFAMACSTYLAAGQVISFRVYQHTGDDLQMTVQQAGIRYLGPL
jgi:hypothetical protein